jgi:HlyD family secretion protein
MKRRVAIAVVLLAVVAGGLWWGLDRRGEADAPLRLYGNIDIREVALGFQANGRVERLTVDEGGAVQAGAVLGELDRDGLLTRLREAEAGVSASEARLSLLRAGSTRAEIDQVAATVEERRAALRDAQADVDRLRTLRESGAIAERDYENAASGRDEAAARLRNAEGALADVRAGARPEEVAEAAANLERARAAVESIRIQLDDTVLRAPAAGVILTRAVEPGALVSNGQTAFTLSLVRPVWARVFVDAENLGRMAPGARVRLTADGAPGRIYAGQVGYVSPTAEFTPKTVEAPELRTALVYRARVRQGMPVTVEFPDASPARR